MKKYVCIPLLALPLLLAGCRKDPYELSGPTEEIVSIEIVDAENSREYTVIKSLD